MPDAKPTTREGFVSGAALIAVAVGAVGSVGLQLYVGRHNKSWFVLGLIAVWVLSPFVILGTAHVLSKRWRLLNRSAIHGLMLVIVPASLAIYASVAFGPPRPKPAFWFVALPPMSWLLIAIVLSFAAVRSRSKR